MALYTFYPCKPDGTSDTFTSLELQDDVEAYCRALDVLDDHEAAAHVVIWDDDRRIAVRARLHPDLALVLGGLAPRTRG